MIGIESAAAVYAALDQTLSPKARKSLQQLKAACDLIVASRGVMNYTRVGRVATENFGGPKAQSVLNNKDLKRYVGARILEYAQDKKGHKLPPAKNPAKGAEDRTYPTPNLDTRTKVYIDQLHTRLEVAESGYRELRQWQEAFTRANPVDLADAVGQGPSESAALQLRYTLQDNAERQRLREGIKALLDLPNLTRVLAYETRGDKKALMLHRPTSSEMILDPAQLAAIEAFLEESPDA
jgi:hypothetical protein